MKLVGRIPVEPLDDERLTNIERRVVSSAAVGPARGSSPRWLYGFASVAAVAMIAVVAGWKLRGAPDQVATTAPPTEAPVLVHTAEQASVLDIGDATITSSPGTELAITRPDGGVLVDMSRGKVELKVAKRHGRPPLVVRAGDTDVEVVGTQFSVDYHDGVVEVRVTEGIVRVRHGHDDVRVAAGSAWQTSRGLVAMAELDAAQHDEIEIDTNVKPALRDHTAAVPDPHPTTPHPSADGSASAALSTGAKHTLDDPRDPNHDLKAEIRRQPLVPAMDVGTSEPSKAIVAYRDIWSKNRNADASKALYSTALVQHLRLGRDADALQTLDMYFNRFVGFDEYKPALWLRVRILCLRRLDDSCRAAATSYMDKASGTTASAVAELIANTP